MTYYDENRETRLAYGKEYYVRNKHKCNNYFHKYYQLKNQTIDDRNKQNLDSYQAYLRYYLKRLMKMPDIYTKSQLKRKKTPVSLGLTIYFD